MSRQKRKYPNLIARLTTSSIAAVIMMIGGIIISRLQIFNPVKISFNTPNNPLYLPETAYSGLSCYRLKSDQQTEHFHLPANKTFHLLSWNIHKGQDQGWQQDLAKLSHFGEHSADFVLLQEATNQQQLPPFPTALSVAAFAYQGIESGVTTLTHFTPIHYCGGAMPEPWIRIPKVASAMWFALPNQQSLLVINVHLINFEWNTENYQKQLDSLFSLVETHQGPLILAGDFNSWNEKRQNLLHRLMQKHQLTDVKFSQDERVRFFDHPLDHIFVKGVKIIQANTVALTSSDHNPLMLTFSLE